MTLQERKDNLLKLQPVLFKVGSKWAALTACEDERQFENQRKLILGLLEDLCSELKKNK